MCFELSIHWTSRRSRLCHQPSAIHSCHPETSFNMNGCRGTIVRSSHIDGEMTFVWLHFEPTSARLFSSPSLTIVWSNYQTIYTDFFELLLHFRWLYRRKVFSQLRSQLSTWWILLQLFLIGRCHRSSSMLIGHSFVTTGVAVSVPII